MHKKLLVFSITILLAISFLSVLPSIGANPDTWWDSNWDYKKKITIDHTKVMDNLTNFPILIANTSDDFKNHARSDGYDFRFVDSTESIEYYWELEKYNSTTGELIAWVNITELDADVDTIIYVYYGNNDANTNPSSTSTWNSDYIGVWHMSGSSATEIDDSTSNNNDVMQSTGSISYQQTGKSGDAVDFNDGWLSVSDTGSLSGISTPTLELWVKTLGSSTEWAGFLHKMGIPDNEFQFIGRTSDGYIGYTIYGESSFRRAIKTTSDYKNENWHYLTTSFDGATDINLYMDTATLSPTIDGSYISPTPDTANSFEIGRGGSDYAHGIKGLMDEIRFSKSVRSINWLSTTYNTINSPSTFLTFGSEQIDIPNSTPNKPTCVSPTDTSTNVSIDTTLKVHVIDIDDDTMSVSFYWGNDTLIETINNVQNNTDVETSNLSLDYETVYSWYCVANDSLLQNTSDTFTFTTPINTPPNKPTNPTPVDDDINTSIYTTLKLHVIDIDDDTMSVSFYWGNDTLIETISDVHNNTYAEISSLTLTRNMEYTWYAVANDSLLENTSDTFSFTTTANSPDRPLCVSPTDNQENVSLDTTLKVHVIDITGDNMTVSIYWDDDTLIETISDVQNDTDAETSSLSLDYETIYTWYAVANDSITQTQSYTFSFTTIPMPNYSPDKPTCVSPVDNEEDVSITTTLKVHVIDINNDTISVLFYWSNDTLIETLSNQLNNTDVESSSLLLEYNTSYTWYAVANDSLLQNTSDTFTFTTGDVAIPICEHTVPKVESDGYLYMIYRNHNINVSNLNILMGSYTPFSVWKFNYTSQDWDSNNFTINTNDYIKTKINQSDMPYNDTLILITPQIRFKISDGDEDDKLNITVKSNSSGSWEVVKEWVNVSEGWFICSDSNMNEYNTTYYYTINVTDSYSNNVLYDYSFITTPTEPAIPPITPSITLYMYGFGIVIILTGIGGGMYILSGKKRR